MTRILIIAAMTILFAGCTPEKDMQGHDPVEYYAAHPVVNKVETRYASYTGRFDKKNAFSEDTSDAMQAAFADVSPEAAESVLVQLNPSAMKNDALKARLAKRLRIMGYDRKVIRFEPSESLAHDEVRFDVAYAAVISPRCPDWRVSPVTTYSNSHQPNSDCANQTNIGLMVADPRDLVRGTGDVSADTQRSSKVLEDYNGGKDYMPATTNAGGTTSSSSSSSSSPSSGTAASSPSGQ